MISAASTPVSVVLPVCSVPIPPIPGAMALVVPAVITGPWTVPVPAKVAPALTVTEEAAAMLPFELDATDAIRTSKPNVVAVRVRNATLDELGTGGILAPVIFYSPAAGNEAKLENNPALSKEF